MGIIKLSLCEALLQSAEEKTKKAFLRKIPVEGWFCQEGINMVIEVSNLVKRYGDLIALDHFNLNVEEGEIFGLLGPNGSGKTTAINCMLALLKYDKGSIRIFGTEMSPDAYEVKRNIGVVMQNVAVFEDLTVYENIRYFCGLYIRDRQKCEALTREAIEFTGLCDYVKMRPKKLSGGLLRRLNIACGIAHKPKLIIMDEPTVAVDPQSRNNILEGIKKLSQNGTTVLYTSHYMEEVEQICSKIAIMDQGRVIALGTKDELKAMIKTGEKITVEIIGLAREHLDALQKIPHVERISYENDLLEIHCAGGRHNLAEVLDYLNEKNLPFGRVYSEPPTLNDVFLEITGKELRD